MDSRSSAGARKPKDRDFIRTVEGLFFCVTGYLHPPDRYTAFLKYSPDPAGRWRARREGTVYRREIAYYHVANVAETIRYLEQRYPHYVSDCPVRDIRFSMVPADYVDRYYDPQERLREILADPQDSLEAEARGLALEIARCAGIETDALGVVGSILIRLHHPALSDINLTVYGIDNARRVRAALRQGCSPHIRGIDANLGGRWVREMIEWFPLTEEEARYNVSRRWNYGFYADVGHASADVGHASADIGHASADIGRSFAGRFFGVHPTRTDAEITERYGARIYRGLGSATIGATVTGAAEALFQPAVYHVEQVSALTPPEGSEGIDTACTPWELVREIVSYEGRFRDLVEPSANVEIEARGKLECVNGQWYRLVVGSTSLASEAYIKLWNRGK